MSSNNTSEIGTRGIIIIGIIAFVLIGAVIIVIMAGNRPVNETTTTSVPELSQIKGEDPVQGENHLHSIFYNAISKIFFMGTHNGLYQTSDFVNWTRHEVLGDTDVMSITANRGDPNDMIITGHSIGVMRSVDGGTNYVAMNTGLPNLDVHTIGSDPNDFKRLCAFVVGGGLFFSEDGAQKWSLRNDFVDGVAGITFDPVKKKTIYLATYNYGFMVSSDDGKIFIPMNEGLATTDVAAVVVNPKVPGEIMISVYETGIFISKDSGENWKPSDGSPDEVNIIALYEESPGSGRIYAGGESGAVYFTPDFGKSWNKL